MGTRFYLAYKPYQSSQNTVTGVVIPSAVLLIIYLSHNYYFITTITIFKYYVQLPVSVFSHCRPASLRKKKKFKNKEQEKKPKEDGERIRCIRREPNSNCCVLTSAP